MEIKKSEVYKGGDSRGMFGQGITDVLFFNDMGVIKSITQKGESVCRFIKEKKGKNFEYYYDVGKGKNIKKEIKKLFNLEIKSGTLVEFKLNDKLHVPRYENIVEKLNNEPMLRLINENKYRDLELIHKSKKELRATIKYKQPKGEEILKEDLNLEYEGYPILGKLKLFKSESVVDKHTKGLLIFDKGGAVLAQEDFGFDSDKALDNIFGRLELKGVKKLIIEKLDDQESIVLDSRDGFDKQHDFYEYLKKEVSKILKKVFKKDSEEEKDQSTTATDKKVFEEINKIYENIFEDNSGGNIEGFNDIVENGIEFDRKSISIQKDLIYKIAIKIDRNSDLIPEKGNIKIECDKKNIVLSPKNINIEEVEKTKKICRKIITIRGKSVEKSIISAKIENAFSEMFVNCTAKKYIYPENGLEFYPKEINCKPNMDKEAELFIDLRKIKQKKKIKLNSSNQDINIKEKELIVPPPHDWNEPTITKVKIVFSGKNLGDSGKINANYKKYSADLEVNIRESEPKKNKGIFKGWRFEKLSETYLRPWEYGEDGFIKIHNEHPINKFYFGQNPKKDIIRKDIKAQLYLSELITDAVIVSQLDKMVDKGKIDDDPSSIMYDIYKKKKEWGEKIYNSYVNKKKLAIQSNIEENLLKNLKKKDSLHNSRDMTILHSRLIDSKTYQEIADSFKITRERVRQIIEKYTKKKIKLDSNINIKIEIKDKQKSKELINKIINNIAETHRLKGKDILSATRRKEVVLARSLVCYQLRNELNLSFSEIGRILGDRDHTTIMHAVKKIDKMLKKST